ncbi:UvrB/UvrC motif-containing protein [Caulobacter sp. 17J80-11]|uniref:UvrB/UvrC motif-containing protein n=1 Tax=Caulobacter sp. 17J80-11 TaxID=2763502 RepID=UPI0016534DB3|nr:UvrB/UvrC motif-containing protein [Caulobacter sp. 17J80-11]MBC6982697.1 UvrB/UvrC motif-containing protein [Caulobacter sp. 17J80-11]
MSDAYDEEIAKLEARMARAVEDEDFEAAARLRDEIAWLRRDDRGEAPEGSRLRRQAPGKMGLGTSQETYVQPDGWTPPPKPDLMTRVRKGRRRKG